MGPNDKIGERWREILDRVNVLMPIKHEMHEFRQGFLDGMHMKLSHYKAETYITAKQLNLLNAIEREHLETHRGRDR